jgi:hypothetical protein
MMRVFLLSLSAVLLSACGEFDQSKTAGRNKPDVEPWQGAKNPYVAQGWTPGDKTAWETQLRTRSQSQNEYVKTN